MITQKQLDNWYEDGQKKKSDLRKYTVPFFSIKYSNFKDFIPSKLEEAYRELQGLLAKY